MNPAGFIKWDRVWYLQGKVRFNYRIRSQESYELTEMQIGSAEEKRNCMMMAAIIRGEAKDQCLIF